MPNRILFCAAVTLAATVGYIQAASYTWTPTGGGAYDWDDAANWSSGFPNAVDDVANLTADATGDQTVNLNQPITVGTLNTGDADGSNTYLVAPGGGSLMFEASGSAALSQSATSAGDTVSADITLASNLAVRNDSTVHPLTLSGSITGGTQTLTKTGAGKLVLSGTTGYTGHSYINAGTLPDGALQQERLPARYRRRIRGRRCNFEP